MPPGWARTLQGVIGDRPKSLQPTGSKCFPKFYASSPRSLNQNLLLKLSAGKSDGGPGISHIRFAECRSPVGKPGILEVSLVRGRDWERSTPGTELPQISPGAEANSESRTKAFKVGPMPYGGAGDPIVGSFNPAVYSNRRLEFSALELSVRNMENHMKGEKFQEVEDTIEDHKAHPDVASIENRLRHLTQNAAPFYRKHNLMVLYLLMIPGCLVPSVTLGFDSAMVNGLQAVETWNDYFDNPQGGILGLLTAILSLGAICGTPFISVVGDRWGRRKGILLGSAIMAVGGIIQGSSVNIGMFILSRFLVGFGLVFANTYAPILIGELSHPKDRQVATSLYETTWYLGATMAAWITFGTFAMPNDWAWRIPSLLQAVPALITTTCVLFLPESPRWLIANGQPEKAKEILTKYHAEGDEHDELMHLEFMEMKQIIEADVSANEITWRSLLANRGNRRRMLLMVMLGIFSQWSGNGLVSYYLSRVLETVGISSYENKNTINGCLMIWSWICSICSAFLTAYLRRRTQFLISTAGMLAVFACQTLCAGLFNELGDQAAGYAVIAMLFLFYTFYNLGFNALLYSYPVEVLPYPIRAKGFTVLMFFGKAANFFNSFVNPVGLAAIGWKYYIVYVGWLAVELCGIYLYLVETKGPSLEAIASRFDEL